MNFIRAVHVAVIVSFLIPKISVLAVEIKDFQPAIVPIRSVTTLNVATAGQLNANSTIQCRFNYMSMPAELKGSMVFCNTPPMRQIDKAVLHLEVDGKLFKAKKQLRLHEPFKVTDISPKIASPSEQLSIQVNGITCEKWMTFFVRFQTANGTKRTQKGICNNSTITCYIPEFPAHALLRVGVTLSNRIVEWSPTKLRIQYPLDSIKSSLKDLQPNIKRSGAFTFRVVLRDKFKNSISEPGNGSNSPLSVQYSPSTHPKKFHFLTCKVSLITDKIGSEYGVGCHGAKHERILIYPSINNVPVGGTASYEVRTTMCPGKTSCDDKSNVVIIVSSSLGMVLLVVLAVLLYKYRFALKRKFVTRKGIYPDETSTEMNEFQGNPKLAWVDLPESHVNKTAISSDEEKSEKTEITKYNLRNSEKERLEKETENLEEEVQEDIEELFMYSVENVPGAYVNTTLSTENREDINEAKSASKGKEELLEVEDEMENFELQEMKMSTAEHEPDEKF